jgi:carboxyl-terminal processing protease
VKRRTVYDDLQMFSQVLNQIRVNHPDSADTHELFMAAIEAMVHAADPHSYVIVALKDTSKRAEQLSRGKLLSVPIEFEFFGGAPVVMSVAPRSEAARLDILPGDELLAVGSAPVTARNAEELALELAGPRNSTVSLRFERWRLDGSLATLDRVVKRERVEEASAVGAVFMLDPHTGYLRITTFAAEHVADEVRAGLSSLERQGMDRLVLDLRDNGGGAVQQASSVAGEFLPTGAVVYTSEGRKAETNDTVRVKRSFWKREKRYPIVVLVNRGTASASELLAGALQDHDRALIVGRPTFGKSLITRGFPLADGSILVLVVGRFRTPCGRVIQRGYRRVTAREYYRLAAADRDTVGLPSCHTDGGRTAYGGGGVFPDVTLPAPGPRPLWLALVLEQDLPLQWVGGYVSERRAALGTVESFEADPKLPADAAAAFRAFAAKQGVEIPSTPEADAWVGSMLLRQVAAVAFGDEVYYRVSARLDPQVAAAAASFGKAEGILTAAKQP